MKIVEDLFKEIAIRLLILNYSSHSKSTAVSREK